MSRRLLIMKLELDKIKTLGIEIAKMNGHDNSDEEYYRICYDESFKVVFLSSIDRKEYSYDIKFEDLLSCKNEKDSLK